MSIIKPAVTPAFLECGGELGMLIRQYDWDHTDLGSPDGWPQSLRTALGLVLRSKFPMFLFWGKDLRCFYNDALAGKLGFGGKHPQMLGKPAVELCTEEKATCVSLLQQVLQTDESAVFENKRIPIYRNGLMEDSYWSLSLNVVHNEEDKPAGIMVNCTETTREVQSAGKFQLLEQRFVNLVREATIGIIILSGTEMRVDIVNKAYANIIGRTPEQLLGNPLFSIIPETEKEFRPILEKVLSSGENIYSNDHPFSVFNGNQTITGYLNLVFQPYKEEDGSITGVLVICHDVTEQVKAHLLTEKSEQNLRNVIAQAPVAMSLLRGPQFMVEYTNKLSLQFWDRTMEDVIGRPAFDVLPEVAGKGFEDILFQVFTSGQTYSANNIPVPVKRNGAIETTYVSFTFEPYREPDGMVSGIMVIGIDVTKQVLARRKIMEAEERTRLAMESADLGMYEVNLLTNHIETSAKFDEMIGLESSQFHSEYINAVHPDDKTMREEAHRRAIETGILDYMPRVIKKDGTIRWIRIKGKVYFDDYGKPYKLMGIGQDLTEQVELERQKDSFLGIASHELKTPVTSIKAYAQLMEKMFHQSGDAKNAALMAKLNGQANRLSNLIGDLLDVTKINNGKLQFNFTTFNFSQVVEEVIDDLQQTTNRHHIVKKLQYTGTIMGDKERISQVIINLLSNAIKYSPDASQIIVRTQGLHTGEVQLCVQDFGIGISNDKKERVFEQFYRVTGNRQHTFPGLGLGLYISSEIIKRMDGHIWVNSTEGEGATFCFTVPIHRS